MKRLLLMLTMLATLLSPGLSQASTFVFGSAFDDALTLEQNLAALAGVSAGTFTEIQPGNISTSTKYTLSAVGYSQKAVDAELNITVGHDVVFSTSKPFASGNEFSADELMFRFTNFITDQSNNAFLSALLLDSTYISAAYELSEDLEIDGTTYVEGTIFISFIIPDWDGYKSGTDFILALSPSAAVPVPAAVWLLGSGVAGLMTLRRKLR